MKAIQWLLPSAVVVVLVAVATGCPTSKAGEDCTPSNCAGCCDAQGQCQSGIQQDACGLGGLACAVCTASQTCGGGVCANNSTGPGSGGSITLDQLCEQFVSAQCDAMVRCGFMTSTASCLAAIDSTHCATDQKAAVKDGRIVYHGDKAKACLDLFKSAASCDELYGSESPGACAEVFEGKVPTHGTCFVDDECLDTDACNAGSTCPGQCLPRKTAGQSVDLSKHEACAKGLYEYYAGSSSYLCEAPVALGASCAPLGGATTPQRCATGSYCDQASHLCVAKKEQGSVCANDDQCLGGLFCQNGTCGALAGLNETCADGSKIDCMYDLTCVHSSAGVDPGVCQAPGGAGATCSNSWGSCKDGFYCAGYSYSPPTNGTCTAFTPLGGACTDDVQCGSSAYCPNSGVCTARKAIGAACMASEECLNGSCSSGICTSYSCNDPTP